MTVFVQFIADNAQYVYALCALVALYLLRVAFVARRERRSAMFPLEREVALGRIYRAFGLAIFLLVIMGAVYAVGVYLLPQLQQGEVLTTPTPDLLVLIDTPTPTLPPPTATPTITPTTRPRPTRAVPTVGPETAATPVPAVRPPACPNPGAAIASPGIGQVDSG